MKNGAADAPITFEEIVMVMITDVISYLVRVAEQNKQTNGIKIIRAKLGSSAVLKINFCVPSLESHRLVIWAQLSKGLTTLSNG